MLNYRWGWNTSTTCKGTVLLLIFIAGYRAYIHSCVFISSSSLFLFTGRNQHSQPPYHSDYEMGGHASRRAEFPVYTPLSCQTSFSIPIQSNLIQLDVWLTIQSYPVHILQYNILLLLLHSALRARRIPFENERILRRRGSYKVRWCYYLTFFFV